MGTGYQPMPKAEGQTSIDCGYFGLDANIARALGQRSHLGYCLDHGAWASIQVMRSTGGPLTIPADHRALLRIADVKLEFLGKERNDNVTV